MTARLPLSLQCTAKLLSTDHTLLPDACSGTSLRQHSSDGGGIGKCWHRQKVLLDPVRPFNLRQKGSNCTYSRPIIREHSSR